MPINNSIINQKGTPAFFSDIFANRPAFGYAGRVFISTDTGAIYEDTGTSWTLIADAGAGTTGTLQQVTTNGNTTTLGIVVQGININDGAGTGLYNTAVGTNNLSANTTGAQNTAVGFNSLVSNTTGGLNTAIGNGSLAANTTASNNTAIGLSSLSLNTTGASNTGVGVYSLQSNATGSLNTAIGYTAGQLITTGSNNTIIGNYGGTSTLASNIVLSDGAGNVRLFSDANGLIGINQAVGSTIGGQLDIHTTQTYALVLNGLSTSNAYTAFSNASVGKWRIGNTYNAGANTFDIFNLGTSSNALSFNSTTNAATFTSALSGTSASFSSSVTALSFTSTGVSNGNGIVVVQDQDGRQAAFKSPTPLGGIASIGSTTNHDFRINTGDASNVLFLGTKSGTNWLSFASTGAATFSSIVTIGGRIDFSANSSATASGQIGRDATYGLFNWASPGLTDDYAIFSVSGAYIMHTPTGTANTVLGGALNGTSATFSSTIQTNANGAFGQGIESTIRLIAASSGNTSGSIALAARNLAGTMGFAIYGDLTSYFGGIINTTSRVNVNGATDNALFSLNSGGTLYTVGFSPNATANSNNTLTLTTAQTTWIYTGTGLATWTLPNPSGTNQMFWIKNAGTGIITLNAFAGTNIIDNSATSVSSITIAVGATALIQQDGNVKSYQLQ